MVTAPRCEACGIASTHDIQNVALLVAGQLRVQAKLCPGCLDDLFSYVRFLVEGDRVVRVTRR